MPGMASALFSENKQLRRRVRELEGEVSFLQDQNYHIQRVNDTYRGKVLQYIESLRSKGRRGSSPAFATAKDLEELVRRLRAHDITHSSSRPRVEEMTATVFPKGSITREGDDGLMNSTSSLSRATQEGEGGVHVAGRSNAPRKEAFSPKGKKTQANESAAVKNAQRATVLNLTAENRKLVSLVDTLRSRLAAAGRLNSSLEKKYRALSSLMGCSCSSGSGRQQDVARDKMPGLPELEKQLRELGEENEKLRSENDHNKELFQELSHYRILLSRKTVEVEVLRQRESILLEEINDLKGKLAKTTETLQTMGTALRLGKVREKRAISAMETLQKKTEEQELQRRQQVQETRMTASEIQPAFLSAFIERVATALERHHFVFSEYTLACHMLHVILHGRFTGQRAQESMWAIDFGWKSIVTETLFLAAEHLANLIKFFEETTMVHIASVTSSSLAKSGVDAPVAKASEDGDRRGCLDNPGTMNKNKRLQPPIQLFTDDGNEVALKSEDEDKLLSSNPVRRESRSIEGCVERSHAQMVDAATITVSPVQISLAVGCSLPVSPQFPSKGTETISPLLISRAVGEDFGIEGSALVFPVACAASFQPDGRREQ
ncbi:hypothetical protein TcYC6_0013420 [Trypanosoma cruzi]|nr:hypothetical protein TcYC6_0013420 [Trypanosoma cruzi]